MGHANYLMNLGLTNVQTEDLSDLAGFPSRDLSVTFCSSFYCQGTKIKPKAVAPGLVKFCPFCKSPRHLYHDTVSPKTFDKISIEFDL